MELDPVEVLTHLKALGYENIEPQLLQQFIKDLKKLIKYEKSRVNKKENNDFKFENRYPVRGKTVLLPKNNCKNTFCSKKNEDVFERLTNQIPKTKPCSKAVSTVGVQTDLQLTQTKNNKYSQILRRNQMDPVSLHQYYQNEWLTHKIPGEKNHNQLRCQIRQMMNHK